MRALVISTVRFVVVVFLITRSFLTRLLVRLFDQGVKILEVSDDGCGVPPASRPFLATRSATSKIRSFEDIYQGHQSLGFRGEALFCLANLSGNLIVATRTKDELLAEKLEFNRDGSLRPEKSTFAKKVGTTVAVGKLNLRY
jgi:DNA mismatch repair protein PMS2